MSHSAQTNRLSSEKSPYLRQHQHNPVNWYPWGEEAFIAAKEEDKPIFLSIGYSTCYWCHVMERDSFESQEVADILNAQFISIKTDREERPDIDKIYMDAVMAMTSHGGWPLTTLLTPDLKPFFGGTFFPKAQFIEILNKVTGLWSSEERKQIIESSEGITEALRNQALPPAVKNLEEVISENKTFNRHYLQQKATFDTAFGGFSEAPKFPQATGLRLLLQFYKRSGEEFALEMVNTTLDKMARGGIYDHLGGGFSRYSTDEKWLVPHFEKMLYDNSLLVVSYLEAFQLTENEMFRDVARETLDYLERDMKSPEGGFYAAEDAGDVGREGEYYVWEETEIESILSDEEFVLLKDVYGISSLGNFENDFNILNLQSSQQWSIKQDTLLKSAANKLLAARNLRQRPHLDNKILCAWNGLTISAFSLAHTTLREDNHLATAITCANFIKEHLTSNGRLLRSYCQGEAKHSAYLEDYAYLTQGLLDLYEASGEKDWLNWAINLQDLTNELFWDSLDGGYFFTEQDAKYVLIRKKDFTDGAIPSANGIAALNLVRLHKVTGDQKHLDRAKELLLTVSGLLERFPAAVASSILALDYMVPSDNH